MLQEDLKGLDHPLCYYSTKFNSHQWDYSTVEKEMMTLVLSLHHFLSVCKLLSGSSADLYSYSLDLYSTYEESEQKIVMLESIPARISAGDLTCQGL